MLDGKTGGRGGKRHQHRGKDGPPEKRKPSKYHVYIKGTVKRFHFLLMEFIIVLLRVPTPQGKQGKWQKKIPVRENTGNLEILPKHREIGLLSL